MRSAAMFVWGGLCTALLDWPGPSLSLRYLTDPRWWILALGGSVLFELGARRSRGSFYAWTERLERIYVVRAVNGARRRLVVATSLPGSWDNDGYRRCAA
jgi:hypothetical protein